MGNLLLLLVKFFLLGKKVLNKNVDVGILRKIKFFMDSVLSVGVLKQAMTNINYVGFLHETGGKTNICIG